MTIAIPASPFPIAGSLQDRGQIFGPDDFGDGPCGWVPLLAGTSPVGPVLPRQHIGLRGTSMGLFTEDGTAASSLPWNYTSAIRRLSLPSGVNKILYDLWLGVASYHNAAGAWLNPRNIDIGVDTGWGPNADGADNRSFYKFRYLVFDENAAGPNQRLQCGTGTIGAPTYTDLVPLASITSVVVTGNVATVTAAAHGFTAGQTVGIAGLATTALNGYWKLTAVTANTFSFAISHADIVVTADAGKATTSVYPVGYNENKRALLHVQAVFDLANRVQDGFAINGQGWGSLASPADNTIAALGLAQHGSLVSGGAASFYGGLNFTVEVYARTTSALGKSQVAVSQPQGRVFA